MDRWKQEDTDLRTVRGFVGRYNAAAVEIDELAFDDFGTNDLVVFTSASIPPDSKRFEPEFCCRRADVAKHIWKR